MDRTVIADCYRRRRVRVKQMSAFGTKRTFQRPRSMSAFGGKADMPVELQNVGL